MNTGLWLRIRDWILLFMLLSISLTTMLTSHLGMVRTIRARALELTARVEQSFSWAGNYFGALEENELLRNENIILSSQLARLREAQIENGELQSLLGFREETELILLPTRIIYKEITETRNTFTIDVGRNDSVEVGMGVVDQRGILGKVTTVSANYAEVMSFLNVDFRVPTKVQPIQAMGIARWEGVNRNRLLLEHVIKTEPVRPGQLVVTSGFSRVFPKGYPVGTIDSIAGQPGMNELQIYLTPKTKLDTAEHAFVVIPAPAPPPDTTQVAPTDSLD